MTQNTAVQLSITLHTGARISACIPQATRTFYSQTGKYTVYYHMQWWKRSEETGTVLAAVPRFPKSHIRYICTQFYIQWNIVQARERNFCSALRYHFPPKRSHTVSFHWTDSVSLFHSGSPDSDSEATLTVGHLTVKLYPPWVTREWSHLHCQSFDSEAVTFTASHLTVEPPPLWVTQQWSCEFSCGSP